MPYDNIISRTDAQARIPEQVSNAILTSLATTSVAMTRMTQIPMGTNQTRMPVLAALPTAFFVSGDTGLKQTTEIGWDNKYLNVEELAALVPIPEAVLGDAGFDVWGSIRPLLEGAIARALDAAILFGTNKPASWPDAIVPAAVAAGHTVARGTASAANGGLAEDVNQLMALVEADGFDVNGFVTDRPFRGRLRSVRATDGQKLMDVSANELEGVPVSYAAPGLWPTGLSAAELVAGDWGQAILGTRQDITYKVLDQAVIQDGTGAIQFNLAQQDMVALRVVARFAYQTSNTVNYSNTSGTGRFPFAVLRSPAA